MSSLVCAYQIESLLGECPVWSSEEQVLYWIDILKGLVHRFDPIKKTNTTVQAAELVSSIGLRKNRKMILTLTKDIALFDLDQRALKIIGSPENDRVDNRFNDGKCDPQGNFWCTSMNRNHLEEKSGALYKVSPGGKIVKMDDQVALGNGMGWSLDNKTFYFTQSMVRTIFAYDFDPHWRSITNKREFIKIDPSLGVPDGLTIDKEGFIWSAIYGGGQVIRYDPKGKKERAIQLPVPRITSCAFGGKDLQTLFITTARENMTDAEIKRYPLSGSLFSINLNIKGCPSAHYLG